MTSPLAPATLFPDLGDPARGVARWTVEIVESRPHDPAAFTQGLETSDGIIYESTGLFGRSSLRTVDGASGEVTARADLDAGLFGEGLTIVNDRIIQLTWLSGRALVYDRATLDLLFEHSYQGEGWGLCALDAGSNESLPGRVLVMSDGSDRLTFRDPVTFEALSAVAVTATGYEGRLDHLNELECVEGLVIANVWQTDRLLVIDPFSGAVAAVIDASPLLDDVLEHADASSIDVLNGVALHEDAGILWMTGKLWPKLYAVRVVEASR
ncbi:MAG: glutaminyl-peptide cyclotransferase [Acidimicrobiaceae bacterium]|nr:glutaminyl-peptide cyclotransferase [Acidimicrobiaceae bacterium]MCY4280171.1 glutaminyl-peptide cyclotransferase [Acidimicrobiaceae bacterium]MCY4293682.1 glutaminyl-peptide cyclotransferase [Acidimicrobiaceae bacterium]